MSASIKEADMTRPNLSEHLYSRLAPPLVISLEDLDTALDIIRSCLLDLDSVDSIEDISATGGEEKFTSL